jgi:hypothetical protein
MIQYKKKDLSKLYNIGDELCTADNYFQIQSDDDITLVGGGVWNIEKLSSEQSARKTVLWAAGKSVRYPSKVSPIRDLNFLEWGIRDKSDLVDKARFLPCVSCMNDSIITTPKESNTLVFTNANLQVSSTIREKEAGITYLTNSCTFENFISAWERSSLIITNSYHGIYWGLLSGREVIPYGYSSKFTNITEMFDIEFPEGQLYSATNTDAMLSLMKKNKIRIQLNSPNQWVNLFRNMNMEFAETKLSKVGISCKTI